MTDDEFRRLLKDLVKSNRDVTKAMHLLATVTQENSNVTREVARAIIRLQNYLVRKGHIDAVEEPET